MGESISRDLIKEYLTKNRIPPPIFQLPKVINSSSSAADQNSSFDCAYKHPIMLLDEQVDNNESFIIPTSNKQAFSSLTESATDMMPSSPTTTTVKSEEENSCRLIGKVNPNIIKTWEQLNGFQLNTNNRPSFTNSENSDQQSCVLFYRKPLNFDKNDDETKFYVNKITHSESSDDFYDSIDDDRSIIENNTYIVEDLMVSSMYQDSEIAAGEGMAECNDSLIDN